ncbi:MAG: hypothetical protein HYZ53_26020 [Planctomycetes bacterium]|nr:hypothetical protein [Planctomycetota bacterium]
MSYRVRVIIAGHRGHRWATRVQSIVRHAGGKIEERQWRATSDGGLDLVLTLAVESEGLLPGMLAQVERIPGAAVREMTLYSASCGRSGS